MSCHANGLAGMASINLHFAQAEITTIGDRNSVLRALDHIRQALACLEIVAAECEPPQPDVSEAGIQAA